jgi:acetyltransferase-like isoleucine patch superfamily enzyme
MEEQINLKFFIKRARIDNYLIIPGILALINGYWHKLKFRLLGKKVKIGKWFRVYGKFRIMGCGSVVIGDNCFILSKFFTTTVFRTVLPDASIEIGDNVSFSGTKIQCFRHITIGNWCNIADAYMVDSPAHHLSADRRSMYARDVPFSPVRLGQNVWVSTKVVICQGVTIGGNSGIGACSLVRSSIPANSFYAGNPACFIKPVPLKSERNSESLL